MSTQNPRPAYLQRILDNKQNGNQSSGNSGTPSWARTIQLQRQVTRSQARPQQQPSRGR